MALHENRVVKDLAGGCDRRDQATLVAIWASYSFPWNEEKGDVSCRTISNKNPPLTFFQLSATRLAG